MADWRKYGRGFERAIVLTDSFLSLAGRVAQSTDPQHHQLAEQLPPKFEEILSAEQQEQEARDEALIDGQVDPSLHLEGLMRRARAAMDNERFHEAGALFSRLAFKAEYLDEPDIQLASLCGGVACALATNEHAQAEVLLSLAENIAAEHNPGEELRASIQELAEEVRV